ncbi:MAG: ImmA/IrrE family metallo-endopeptidase [Nitrospiraceae bacterium]|nr:ImmA/IrrE family metallo-endopeptidase [Nitrospiraceae bacterium]
MSHVEVRPELIRWAQERSGLPFEALQKRFPKFELWESGKAMPTLRQLKDLAKKTLTPVGYFFLPEPPEDKLPIPDFRTVRDEPVKRPSPNLLETVQTMQRRQEWMRDYLIEQGQPPLPFIGAARLTDNVNATAARMRDIVGVTDDWAHHHTTWTSALSALCLALDKAGVIVVINSVVGNNSHRKLDTSEFRGFVLADRHAPLVFVNGADAKAAQMFTLAHEMAHLFIGKGGVFNFRDFLPVNNNVEQFCNHVAAEFLVPAERLKSAWPDAKGAAEPLQVVARRFKVSPLVAARRTLDLGLIDRKAFFTFYHEYQEDERRKKSTKTGSGDFYATQNFRIGRRFAAAVVRAAKEGRLLYNEAYHLTGLYGKTYDRYAERFE